MDYMYLLNMSIDLCFHKWKHIKIQKCGHKYCFKTFDIIIFVLKFTFTIEIILLNFDDVLLVWNLGQSFIYKINKWWIKKMYDYLTYIK
jgi:hypothetical protein